jgi:hypothetical protein
MNSEQTRISAKSNYYIDTFEITKIARLLVVLFVRFSRISIEPDVLESSQLDLSDCTHAAITRLTEPTRPTCNLGTYLTIMNDILLVLFVRFSWISIEPDVRECQPARFWNSLG